MEQPLSHGGIGWDFKLTDELKLRPIFNFALGNVTSDLRAASWYVGQRTGRDIDFLDRGSLNAYGLGGSIMLDYEHYRPGYEVDVELWYSDIGRPPACCCCNARCDTSWN